MSKPKHPPGSIRDAILGFLTENAGDASVAEIRNAVEQTIGSVPPSSVRSYLRLRPDIFERTIRGRYKISDGSRTVPPALPNNDADPTPPAYTHGNATLYQADSFQWMANREPNSIHAVVTDPPYGLVEYSEKEQLKLLSGKGGVWRIPPAFDGHIRSPLPRFTTLTASDLQQIRNLFKDFGCALTRVLVPGAHVFVASNPLLSYIVADALDDSGLENRGIVTRLVMTMRGGDRPKNAHEEFSGVTVMPRSMAEPWLLFRKPLEGRVQDNLRKWGTGGLRRVSPTKPFGDVIESHPTRSAEKKLAPHPSLKPQAFLRQLVRAALPMEKGDNPGPLRRFRLYTCRCKPHRLPEYRRRTVGSVRSPWPSMHFLNCKLSSVQIYPVAAQLLDAVPIQGRRSSSQLSSWVSSESRQP